MATTMKKVFSVNAVNDNQPIQINEVTKRPILLPGETLHLLQEGVGLYENDSQIVGCQQGILYLTTCRLVWQETTPSSSLAALLGFSLSRIQRAESETPFIGYQKIAITLRVASSQFVIKFGFRGGGRDVFYTKLLLLLSSKLWLQQQPQPPQQPQQEVFDTSKAGVGGIMRNVSSKSKETDLKLKQAFADLDALMAKAKEMVDLANRFASSSKKSSINAEEDAEFRTYALQMGISMSTLPYNSIKSTEPSEEQNQISTALGFQVTKENAGSLYHSQLAREVAEVMIPILQREGKMMALTDVYCVINRQRGTALISPEDLYKASLLLSNLNLPVHLRQFQSGVIALELDSRSDKESSLKIVELVKQEGKLTAFDVSKFFNCSLVLAEEQLLIAEREALLCRDESFEGVAFYYNFFNNDINTNR